MRVLCHILFIKKKMKKIKKMNILRNKHFVF